MKITVNHIGKMEGHTDFVAEILKGDVKSAKIMTTEGARLIEGILVGRNFYEAPIITSRICGICPVVHKVSSIKAIEQAFSIKSSEQTVKLRKLMLTAQIIHSHALHLFFLSLPDFFNINDDLKFIGQHKRETKSAIAVREWALKAIEIVGGRAVHPIACEVGGFKVLPRRSDLKILLNQYPETLRQALVVVDLALKIKLPKFKRPTSFIALTDDREYAYYGGDIKILPPAGEARVIAAKNFTKNIKEIEEPYRAAKSARLDGEPFMVGALARINLSHDCLHPLARGIYRKSGWHQPETNSFRNIIAQAIEIVHFLEEAKLLLDDLVNSLSEEKSLGSKINLIAGASPIGRASIGCDAVEAPRGTLYHSYKIDANGILTDCQIITPTVSFLKNLEEDIIAYLPDLKSLSDRQRSMKIRTLIRAYDPCIACATH
ncbi:MAG: nickel-dependent hydrogenase large subunit [Patescibacteria group bacterium]